MEASVWWKDDPVTDGGGGVGGGRKTHSVSAVALGSARTQASNTGNDTPLARW
jgi:hypothetical protein